MTAKTLTAATAFILLLSCNSTSRQNTPDNDMPPALTNTTTSYDIEKKRGYQDLIESLYSELVAKDPKLKSIEEYIDTLNRSQGDSTHAFLEFDEKNRSYFTAAHTHGEHIKDSILRKRITTLIANNLYAYHSKVSKHITLLNTIDTNNSSINDLHTVLKIVTTLPVIRKYQDRNLPETTPLADFAERQSHAIKLMDTLIRK